MAFLGPPDSTVTALANDGVMGWQPHIQAFIRAVVAPGSCAVDFGAGIGVHTIAMAGAVGPDGRVFAAQCNPALHVYLRSNLALQAVPDGVVDVVHHPVPLVPLDTLRSVSAMPFSFIKLDVDGLEAGVLRSGKQVLAVDRPILVVHVLMAEVLQVVHDAVYDIYRIKYNDPRPGQGAMWAVHICVPCERRAERDWRLCIAQCGDARAAVVCDPILYHRGSGGEVRVQPHPFQGGSYFTAHVIQQPQQQPHQQQQLQYQHQYQHQHHYPYPRAATATPPFSSHPGLITHYMVNRGYPAHMTTPAPRCPIPARLPCAVPGFAGTGMPRPLIAIHMFAADDAKLLPLAVHFYRSRFGASTLIVVHDCGTDDTAQVAMALGVRVHRVFGLPGAARAMDVAVRAKTITRVRGTCWTVDDSRSEWFLICAANEFCDLTPSKVSALNHGPHMRAVCASGFEMVCSTPGGWPTTVATGVHSPRLCKPMLFRRDQVTETTFTKDGRDCFLMPVGLGPLPDGFSMFRYEYFCPEFARAKRQHLEAAYARELCDHAVDIVEARSLFTVPVCMPSAAIQIPLCLHQAVLRSLPDPVKEKERGGIFYHHISILQVGCGDGASTRVLLGLHASVIVWCADPWLQTEDYGRFLMNICHVRHRVEVRRGRPVASMSLRKGRGGFVGVYIAAKGMDEGAFDMWWDLVLPGGCFVARADDLDARVHSWGLRQVKMGAGTFTGDGVHLCLWKK